MKTLPSVHPDDLTMVMEKLTDELQPVLRSTSDPEMKEAEKVFLGTLYRLTLSIFDWLPPEQQFEILTACGTWFDIGMMMGRSPLTLVDILRNVKPRLINTDIPDWINRTPPTD